MAYYYIVPTGKKGFITHEDNERAHVANYPGDIFVTENSEWPPRVGAVEKTKAEAQQISDDWIDAHNAELTSSAIWDADTMESSSYSVIP